MILNLTIAIVLMNSGQTQSFLLILKIKQITIFHNKIVFIKRQELQNIKYRATPAVKRI